MLEFNTEPLEKTILKDNSVVYSIKNFYKDPDTIHKWILLHDSFYHKEHEASNNGHLFHDKRQHIPNAEISNVAYYIESIVGHSHVNPEGIVTNIFKYSGDEYKDNYWSPHKDIGWTALIYFEGSGTNLYIPRKNAEFNKGIEHEEPWRKKLDWDLLHHIEGDYNKLVIFKGGDIYHGQAIDQKHTKRLNQVMFFK
mgnify:CR=1 FL=1